MGSTCKPCVASGVDSDKVTFDDVEGYDSHVLTCRNSSDIDALKAGEDLARRRSGRRGKAAVAVRVGRGVKVPKKGKR